MNNPVNDENYEKLQPVRQIFQKITNNYGIFFISYFFLFSSNKEIFILMFLIFNLDTSLDYYMCFMTINYFLQIF